VQEQLSQSLGSPVMHSLGLGTPQREQVEREPAQEPVSRVRERVLASPPEMQGSIGKNSTRR
jgi:hypothetical protein